MSLRGACLGLCAAAMALLAPASLAAQSSQVQQADDAARAASEAMTEVEAEMRAQRNMRIRTPEQTLGEFEQILMAQPSATKALEQWCGMFTGTVRASIVAKAVTGHDAAVPADLPSLLKTTAPLGYRHVRLDCSIGTMSEAHNWYVPARLTPEMNTTLATTDTPFGKVVAPLHFSREPLSSRRGPGPGCPVRTILTHRALLRLPDGQPMALVVECYSDLILLPPIWLPPPPPPCCTAPFPPVGRDGARTAPSTPSNPPTPTLP